MKSNIWNRETNCGGEEDKLQRIKKIAHDFTAFNL